MRNSLWLQSPIVYSLEVAVCYCEVTLNVINVFILVINLHVFTTLSVDIYTMYHILGVWWSKT